MSLHVRVVLTIMGLLFAGLFVALGATFAAIWDWTSHHPAPGTGELLQRVIAASGGATVAVLAAAALTSGWIVRRGLRPLAEISRVADAVGRGDLGQRVTTTTPRTELGRLSIRLNSMLDQLQNAFDARVLSEERMRAFLADASHELRTPLASVRGYAELFRRGAADRPADLAMAMDRIEAEASRMGVLVEDMLLLARLDEQRDRGEQPVDLTDVLAHSVADFRARHPDRTIVDESEAPALVVGAEAELRQLAANLLTNTAQHTPATTTVTVRTRTEDSTAVLEVDDDGPGIPPAEHDRIFDRFYRGDATRTSDDDGNGLGLAIVAAIARRHGGAAMVGSPDHGRGSRFAVHIPARPQKA